MRWRIKHTLLAFLLAILAVLGGAWSYLFLFGGIERLVVDAVTKALGAAGPLQVTIGRIDGTLLNGVTLRDVVVSYRDSVRAFDVITAREVTAQYAFANIINRLPVLNVLYVNGLTVTLVQDSSGRWLPSAPHGSGGGTSAAAPRIAVGQLGLSQSQVNLIKASGDTVVVGDLILSATVELDKGTYAVDIRQLGFVSSLLGAGSVTCSGKATYSDGFLVAQDIRVTQDQTRIKLSGTFDNKNRSGNADLSIDRLDLAQVSSLLGAKLKGNMDVNGTVVLAGDSISGQIQLGGAFLFADIGNLFTDFTYADKRLTFDTLYGTILGACGVDGKAEVNFGTAPETYELTAEIKNFDLLQVAPGALRSDLSGTLTMHGSSFSNATMLLLADVDVHESSFDDYPLHRAAGPIEITTDSLRFPEAFRVDYFENTFYVTGSIEYSRDMCLSVDADLRNLDRYRGKLFIDQPGGRGQAAATLTGRTNDPDLAGWFASDSLWVYGLYTDSAYCEFDITRFLTGRRGQVTVDLRAGNAWQAPYDSASALITLDSQYVRIDSVTAWNPYATIDGHGRLNQGIYPWELSLDTLSLSVLEREFANRGPLLVVIDTSGFDFKRVTMGQDESSVTADGRINYDESMSLSLAVDHTPVASWLHLFRKDLELDAYLSGQVDLRGTFLSPVFSTSMAVDSLVYRGVALGDLRMSANYADQRIGIDSLRLHSDQGEYSADGFLYVDLAFTTDEVERLPDRPLDLRVTATDTRFDLVQMFLPSVEDLAGVFVADVQLSGTPGAPHLNGNAYIRNARLKYVDLADTLKADSAAVTMVDNRIEVNDIEVYVYDKKKHRNAYATIDGALTVKTIDTLHYDIDITLPREFPFRYELDDIEGVVEGDLRVYGNTPPQVTGDLTVTSLRYLAEFATEEQGSPLMTALSGEDLWDLNINIDVLSNYWIKNQDIDAEFSGFMNLIRENGRYRFVGQLEILKGKGYLFDKTFRIEAGSLVTFEDIDYPNPNLDITATTRIPVAPFYQAEQEKSQVELTIHITGTLEKPELDVGDASAGSFTREDILPLIVANTYGAEPGTPGQFDTRVAQLMATQAEKLVTQKLGVLTKLGVETFEIDPAAQGQLDLRNTSVTLGLYAPPVPNLYLYGKSSMSFDRKPDVAEVGFEYRFSKVFLLEGRRDEDEEARERYQMNLKLNWEW